MSLQYGGVLRTPSVGDSTPNARLLIESDHNRVSGSGDLGVFRGGRSGTERLRFCLLDETHSGVILY